MFSVISLHAIITDIVELYFLSGHNGSILSFRCVLFAGLMCVLEAVHISNANLDCSKTEGVALYKVFQLPV